MTYIEYLNRFNRRLEQDSLTDKAIILYYAMLDMFNRRGWPRWASVDTLTLMTMVRVDNKPTAYRARDALVKAGLLAYKPGRKGKVSEYSLTVIGNDIGNKFDTENVTGTVTESVTENVTESVTENVTPNKTKTKTKTKTVTPLPPAPEDYGFGQELTEALAAWSKYRKEMRKPLTQTGTKMLVNKIRKYVPEYGEAAIVELIEQSMSCGWQGIFFNRLEEKKTRNVTQEDRSENVFMRMLREEEEKSEQG